MTTSGAGIDELRRLIVGMLAIGTVISAVGGAESVRRSRLVMRNGCYPYPGMLVVRDTPIVTGRRARRQAVRLLAGGVLGLVVVPAMFLGIGVAFDRVLDSVVVSGGRGSGDLQRQTPNTAPPND